MDQNSLIFEEELKKEIGRRLKLARESVKPKCTQEQLAEKIPNQKRSKKSENNYVSVQSISHWENGKNLPNNDTVYEVYSEISGYTVDYLKGYSDDPYDTEEEAIAKELEVKERMSKRTAKRRLDLTKKMIMDVAQFWLQKEDDKYYLTKYVPASKLGLELAQDGFILSEKQLLDLYDILQSSIQNHLELLFMANPKTSIES